MFPEYTLSRKLLKYLTIKTLEDNGFIIDISDIDSFLSDTDMDFAVILTSNINDLYGLTKTIIKSDAYLRDIRVIRFYNNFTYLIVLTKS